MKKTALLLAAMAMLAPPAFADEKPSEEEATKVAASAKAWGCTGGEYEKESEGSGVFEIDDATCADGNQYDMKFDDKFVLIAITRD